MEDLDEILRFIAENPEGLPNNGRIIDKTFAPGDSLETVMGHDAEGILRISPVALSKLKTRILRLPINTKSRKTG